MELKELTQIVKQAGVAGAGGAGFPSYGKLDARAKTIILNCAECEPLLRLHRQLLEVHAFEILSTLELMAKTVGAEKVIIGVKEAYTSTVEAVKAEMGSFSLISLGLLPEIYPAGDEVVLIHETTGKVVPPGSIPIEVGVAVFNVETVYNIYQALNHQMPVTKKYITITGEVAHPCTRIVPIGMKVEEVLKLAGGVTAKNPVYIMGGPMTGPIVGVHDVITKTSNAILVLEDTHPVVMKKKGNSQINLKRAMASCCQCQMCTDLCPRYLLGHPIEPHAFMRAASSGTTQDLKPFLDTMFCVSCGLCEMYSCMQGLSPRSLIQDYKMGLRAKGVPVPKGVEAAPVKREREYRKVPLKRLQSRLGLDKYDSPALLDEQEVTAKLVKIKLSQHIGAPAVAMVKVGDEVKAGQIIGQAKENALSLPVHASIDGVVTDVNEKAVTIKAR
ncbi:MAG: SLBB domain-containing protein [Roseburia sp.]|nr:SLBB domain-containing protein [Roseburia sp.]